MNIGAFSVSLAVKDLQTSRLFYETLGFTIFGGDESEKWLIIMSKTLSERTPVESESMCPLCGGTGCDREPLTSSDQVAFLFPRCQLCNGAGRLTPDRYEKYLTSLDELPRVVVRRGKDLSGLDQIE